MDAKTAEAILAITKHAEQCQRALIILMDSSTDMLLRLESLERRLDALVQNQARNAPQPSGDDASDQDDVPPIKWVRGPYGP